MASTTTGSGQLAGARGSWWEGLFVRARFWYAWAIGIVLLAAGVVLRPSMLLGAVWLTGLVLLAVFEFWQISRAGRQLRAVRRVDARLSLGDDNPIRIEVDNASAGALRIELLDELPEQLQVRDFGERFDIGGGGRRMLAYPIRPLSRGVYRFGEVLLFVGSGIGLTQRRYRFGSTEKSVAVYPSVFQMKQQALRVRQLLVREGAEQRQRQLGRSYEFDQIREYVAGDDYRLVNWKATARANALMLNTYVEERSQQIVALIDTSRAMLSPFDGLSLLDYSINSTLALLNVALLRGDRIGLIGFDRRPHTSVPVSARPEHLRHILEVLYHQEPTDYEADYAALYQHVQRQVRGRSLLMLYSNFDTLVSLERSLPALRQLARAHLLVVVMFVNARVAAELEAEPTTLEGAYLNTVAAEYEASQAQIAATLRRNGIVVLRTPPQQLTANAVTRYLAVKRGGGL